MRYTKIFLKFRTKKVLLQQVPIVLRKKCIFVIVNIFLAVPRRMNEGEIFTVHINCDAGQDPEIYSLHQNLPPFYYNLFTAIEKERKVAQKCGRNISFCYILPPAFLRKKSYQPLCKGKQRRLEDLFLHNYDYKARILYHSINIKSSYIPSPIKTYICFLCVLTTVPSTVESKNSHKVVIKDRLHISVNLFRMC